MYDFFNVDELNEKFFRTVFDRGKCTGYMYLVFNLLNSKNSNTFIKAYHKFTKCKCSLKKMSRVHSNIDVLLHDPCILGELNNAK